MIESQDGTTLAVDVVGDGPAVVCVGGALNDRHSTGWVAARMPAHKVYSYDRRGRGDSATPSFVSTTALAREIEDLAAVIAEAGGEAMVYGMSSGAILALKAALAGLPITRLALYEPPFAVPGSPTLPSDYEGRLAEATPAEALELFMTGVVGLPPEAVAGIRQSPMWPTLEALAPSLRYDAVVVGDAALPALSTLPALPALSLPVTVLTGAASPPWMREAAETVVNALPNACLKILPDQTHDVDPEVLAAALTEAFT